MNTTTNEPSLLDQIMANDEDIRARFRAMAPVPPEAVGRQLTVKEQDDRTARLRYKPWSVR